eukprot:9475218-Pyramimonas_sp.AAC.1
MTSASRLSPKVHLALLYLARDFFRIENVVSVRLAKGIHKLPPVAYADNCTLLHCDNDVNPGFQYDEADGTSLNIYDITGLAHSRIIQCLKSTKPQAGFDQDMAKFEELADEPAPDRTAREAPEAEPPQEDGRLPTMYEESEADLEAAHYGSVVCRTTRSKGTAEGNSIRGSFHSTHTHDSRQQCAEHCSGRTAGTPA